MRATLECMRIRSTASVSPITRNEGWRAVPDGNRSECRDLTPPAVIEQTAQKQGPPQDGPACTSLSVSCPSVLCGYFSTLSPSLPFRTGRAHSTHRPTWVSRHLGSKSGCLRAASQARVPFLGCAPPRFRSTPRCN